MPYSSARRAEKGNGKKDGFGRRILRHLTPSYESPSSTRGKISDLQPIRTKVHEEVEDLERVWEKRSPRPGAGMGGRFRGEEGKRVGLGLEDKVEWRDGRLVFREGVIGEDGGGEGI